MRLGRAIAAVLMLILAGHAGTALGQRRGGPPPKKAPGSVARRPTQRGLAASFGADNYWEAQRNIAAAVRQLEDYLRESPDGERAPTARQQLAVLRDLTAAASPPEWVPMGKRALREVPEWRVASIDLRPDQTRLTIEIACRRQDGGSCYFLPFGRFPLTMVDQAGRYHPMLESGDLPPDVRQKEHDERVVISGGRVVNVTADFAPLAGAAVSGQVYYRDDNQAQPARFSLARRR